MDPFREIPLTPSAHRLRVHVLGSGSSGNAIAVTGGDRTVLLDCGLSARETMRRLTLCGLDPGRVAGILVSHEHSDHARGVRVLSKRLGIPVWASLGTRRASGPDTLGSDVRRIDPGESLSIGGITVTAFKTSHDAAEPLGFRFDAISGSFGVLTDTGEVTPDAFEALAGCELLGIESNHCPRMLRDGPYPAFLKRRIASATGHLSNQAAAEACTRLASDNLKSIVALHLSSTNNTASHAAESLRSALAGLDHPAVVMTASQELPCPL